MDVEAAVREVYLLACHNECVINRNNKEKGGVALSGGRRLVVGEIAKLLFSREDSLRDSFY